MPKRRIKVQRDVVLPRVDRIRDYTLCVIAIEGEKTEKQYFNRFGNRQVKVDVLPTLEGRSSTTDIMERLVTYKQDNNLLDTDTCWLVFDVDHRDDETLETICVDAREEGFMVAISNPCLEFWLFLHSFDASELDQSIHQALPLQRSQTMKQCLHYNYQSLSYKEFRADVAMAIQRAKHNEKGRKKPFPGFPGTDVYKLVDSLPVTPPQD